MKSAQPLLIALIFLWIGYVSAISFLEAWLKFQAPGVSLEIGLGIGRLVFQALNKVEWVLAVSIGALLLIRRRPLFSWEYLFFLAPLLALILQTSWLLPALDLRADGIIHGELQPPSNLHFYYVGLEVWKVLGLFLLGIQYFKIKP